MKHAIPSRVHYYSFSVCVFVPDHLEIEVVNDKEVICHLNGDCESTEGHLAATQETFVTNTKITNNGFGIVTFNNFHSNNL